MYEDHLSSWQAQERAWRLQLQSDQELVDSATMKLALARDVQAQERALLQNRLDQMDVHPAYRTKMLAGLTVRQPVKTRPIWERTQYWNRTDWLYHIATGILLSPLILTVLASTLVLLAITGWLLQAIDIIVRLGAPDWIARPLTLTHRAIKGEVGDFLCLKNQPSNPSLKKTPTPD